MGASTLDISHHRCFDLPEKITVKINDKLHGCKRTMYISLECTYIDNTSATDPPPLGAVARRGQIWLTIAAFQQTSRE